MTNLVKCMKQNYVRVPDGVACKNGDDFPCPKSCAFKWRCAGVKSFAAVSVTQTDEEKANDFFKAAVYTEEEIKANWGITSSPAPRYQPENRETQRVAEEEPQPPKNDDSTGATVRERPAVSGGESRPGSFGDGVSRRRSFGEETSRGQTGAENVRPSSFGNFTRERGMGAGADGALKPKRNYGYFEMSGKYYSDDPEICKKVACSPLGNALRDIFGYWETRCVFKNDTELKDDFIWLLTSVSRRNIRKCDIDEILLNEAYSRGQKFFYLFYGVIFRYDPPNGFYWCDGALSDDKLTALFRDLQDFNKRYCGTGAQGRAFREFYAAHKREALYFLGCANEEKLFDDMTVSLARDEGAIVLIDKYNGFTPVYLGKINEFIENMKIPTEPERADNMLRFLEKYRVTKRGVSPRPADFPLFKSERGNLEEDMSMYSALGLTSSARLASEYDAFVSLICEYVKSFDPEKIRVGNLVFSKSDWSAEIEELVADLCKLHFGNAPDEDVLYAKGSAWLVKSLYERKIFPTFIAENETRLNELMKLVSKPDLKLYFSLFDKPLIRLDGRDITVREYISAMLQGDAYEICGIFKEDEIIKGYFDSKIRDKSKADLSEIIKTYEKQYEAFQK